MAQGGVPLMYEMCDNTGSTRVAQGVELDGA